jgi:hypothetical protein
MIQALQTIRDNKQSLVHVFASFKFGHERDDRLAEGATPDGAKSSMEAQSLVNHGSIARSCFERQLASELFLPKRWLQGQSSPEKFIHVS